MAQPEYKESLDYLDMISVCLYRGGITLFALSCLLYALILTCAHLWPMVAGFSFYTRILFATSALFSGTNIHVYSKLVRAIIRGFALTSLLLLVCDTQQHWLWLSLGVLFVSFSAIALKESFCFRVFGLKLVPVLLIAVVCLLFFNYAQIAGGLLILTAVCMGYLAVQKWRMPLYFDIGVKANYQY